MHNLSEKYYKGVPLGLRLRTDFPIGPEVSKKV